MKIYTVYQSESVESDFYTTWGTPQRCTGFLDPVKAEAHRAKLQKELGRRYWNVTVVEEEVE